MTFPWCWSCKSFGESTAETTQECEDGALQTVPDLKIQGGQIKHYSFLPTHLLTLSVCDKPLTIFGHLSSAELI